MVLLFLLRERSLFMRGGGGGGWGENLKISIFFSGPPPQELNVYSNISMMISFGLVFQIYNFT